MLKKASYIGYTAFLATGPALLTACSSTTAADQPQDPSVLFSLSSDAMHFENPNGLDVTLVMEGVDPDTIWFTDRPTRESGAITTTKLAGEWAKGGTFDIDPPNAALVLHEPTKVDSTTAETLVAEIQNASYDASNKTFRADLKVLQPQEAASLDGNLAAHGDRHDTAWPSRAGAVSLFIDSVSLAAVAPAASASPTTASKSTSPSPTTASKSASASPTTSVSTQASPSQSSTAKPLAVTGLSTSILSNYSLQMDFTAPTNSGIGPFTYQVTMFSMDQRLSAALTPTVTSLGGNKYRVTAPISNDQWQNPGGGLVQGGQPVEGHATFSIAAVSASGVTGLATMSALQITPVPLVNKPVAPPSPQSTQTSLVCTNASTCDNPGSDNVTYNQTLYFQTTIQSNISLPIPAVMSSSVRMD